MCTVGVCVRVCMCVRMCVRVCALVESQHDTKLTHNGS
jgi:hypothetical protein